MFTDSVKSCDEVGVLELFLELEVLSDGPQSSNSFSGSKGFVMRSKLLPYLDRKDWHSWNWLSSMLIKGFRLVDGEMELLKAGAFGANKARSFPNLYYNK